MAQWRVEEPRELDFDGVVALKVTLVAGNVSVLASEDRPRVYVSEVSGRPLVVTHEAGMLTVADENLALEGLMKWFRTMRCGATVTITVPRDCPVQVNLVTADAVIAGMTARTSIKSGSGDVTLDGVTGRIEANTISGVIEAQGLDGSVSFASISGDLALAGGSVRSLSARTVSGKIAADVDLAEEGQVRISTVSGDVALRLSDSTSASVGVTTAGGRIDSAFPGLDGAQRPVGRSVGGTLGNAPEHGTGAAPGDLAITTVSGNVTLLSRPGTTTGEVS